MISPPGLQLLQKLLVDHGRDRGGEALLLPCLHEELEEDIPLLLAGAQRCGGTLFFLNRPDDEWDPPRGPISNDRLLMVEGLLGAAGDALPAKVIVESDIHNKVHARLDGQQTPIEPSLLPILRAAAVISSSAYERFDLILMTAILAPTDPKRRELLWSLLTLNPANLGITGATTVVPILGAGLDPQTDYLRMPALRYVVTWDRVIRRTEFNQAHAVRTISELHDRPLVLFLGAGASASSGIPLGNHYRDMALEEIVGYYDNSHEAAEAFFDVLHDREHVLQGDNPSRSAFAAELTLERVLLETFTDLGVRPRTDARVIREIISDSANALDYVRPGRTAIRELAAKLRGQLIIITVNFDQLIEDGLEVDCQVYFRPEHYKNRLEELVAYVAGDTSKPVPILKLHGSINEPDSLIATIDSTSAGFHDDVRNALNQVLEAAGRPLRWVWIGCSMRDRDMNLWLGGIGASALDEWWVDPRPGTSLDDFFVQHRAPSWHPRGQTLDDRLIVDSADGFLSALAQQVTIGG